MMVKLSYKAECLLVTNKFHTCHLRVSCGSLASIMHVNKLCVEQQLNCIAVPVYRL